MGLFHHHNQSSTATTNGRPNNHLTSKCTSSCTIGEALAWVFKADRGTETFQRVEYNLEFP